MQASIQPFFTWSKDHIFAGGAQNIVLLIEWRGVSTPEAGRKRNHKVAARNIELRIWLESHVFLTGLHGCQAKPGDERSFLLQLGKIHSGQRKYIALEFTLKAAPSGTHDAVWLQWLYKQPPGERIRELPVQKLSLEYSHHTGVLQESCCFHVEKHLELLKMEATFEEAALLSSQGQQNKARDLMTRQADKLLLLAARSGDMLLLREAENMYRKSALESMPIHKLTEEQDMILAACDVHK
ncbi:hypothetical protein PaeBR_04515 [Paenibacillus sp. BR2-3]|uniref:hypothetical protein n=1 Tax=Paenibacillus sp. BR2-3 TaxID=3048494 RepID=UPI003977C134